MEAVQLSGETCARGWSRSWPRRSCCRAGPGTWPPSSDSPLGLVQVKQQQYSSLPILVLKRCSATGWRPAAESCHTRTQPSSPQESSRPLPLARSIPVSQPRCAATCTHGDQSTSLAPHPPRTAVCPPRVRRAVCGRCRSPPPVPPPCACSTTPASSRGGPSSHQAGTQNIYSSGREAGILSCGVQLISPCSTAAAPTPPGATGG